MGLGPTWGKFNGKGKSGEQHSKRALGWSVLRVCQAARQLADIGLYTGLPYSRTGWPFANVCAMVNAGGYAEAQWGVVAQSIGVYYSAYRP